MFECRAAGMTLHIQESYQTEVCIYVSFNQGLTIILITGKRGANGKKPRKHAHVEPPTSRKGYETHLK